VCQGGGEGRGEWVRKWVGVCVARGEEYPYALTKRLGEELVLHWAKIYSFPANSLRFFNVYGPRSRTSGTYGAVFGVFLAQKLSNKPLTIVGDGEQTRDFTYVTDVVGAIYTTAISKSIGEIFNIGSGSTISVNTLVKLLGGDSVHIPKRPGEPDCTFADIKKIQNTLGWNPKVNISDGVTSLLEDISYWANAPVWTPESINAATVDWFKYLSNK
jgi:UDP-glucose 4-epimerase